MDCVRLKNILAIEREQSIRAAQSVILQIALNQQLLRLEKAWRKAF